VSSRNLQLENLQRWLLCAITQPASPRQDEVDQALLPSLQQSAAERLAVYRGTYIARLLEVLREQFPCTCSAVSDELFDQLASGYLQAHPPRTYTLARLADNLIDYLEATRPADWGEFIVDLARLEHAIDRVFDAAGPENLPLFALPPDADEAIELALAPGFTLLALRYPVSSFYTDWKAGRKPEWPTARAQFVALLRRDYVVRRHELTNLQYELLQAISRGEPLAEVLQSALGACREHSTAEMAAEIRQWFATWAADGFFAAVS
jgi:hypothetical protein